MTKRSATLCLALACMLSACANSMPIWDSHTTTGQATSASGTERRIIASGVDYLAIQERDFRQQLVLADGATVERQQDSISITFRTDCLFDVDSRRLNPTGCDQIYHVAEILRKYPTTVVKVNGHTDATGADQYNLDLSERRACAVMDALVNAGVAPSRIKAQGLGKTHPVASNDTEDGKRLNRRVTLDVIPWQF